MGLAADRNQLNRYENVLVVKKADDAGIRL